MKKLFILLFILGCVSGNYLRVSPSLKVIQSFESRKPLPDHTYYYRGSPVLAVIGIKKPYIFNDRFWKKVDESQFKSIVDECYRLHGCQHGPSQAVALIISEAKHVGVWLSRRRPSVGVNDNVVTAVLPQPFECYGP